MGSFVTKVFLLLLLVGLVLPESWAQQETPELEPGRLPYFVSLVDAKNDIQCGGTLISSNLVLTAASCAGALGSSASAIVGFGGNPEKIFVVESFVHPSYDSGTGAFDAMILRLAFSSSKPVVQINPEAAYPSAVPAVEVGILGFGDEEVLRTDRGHIYIAERSCSAFLAVTEAPSRFQRLGAETMCVTDYVDFNGNCQKDIGGPLLEVGDTVDEDLLLGVVTTAAGCITDRFPTLGIRTSAIFDFLTVGICLVGEGIPTNFDCPVVPTPAPTAAPTAVPVFSLTSSPVAPSAPAPSAPAPSAPAPVASLTSSSESSSGPLGRPSPVFIMAAFLASLLAVVA